MITILHELECKLGRLPYAYEVEEYTGLTLKAVTRRLNKENYPAKLMINSTEKKIYDIYKECKDVKKTQDISGHSVQYVRYALYKLMDAGLVKMPPKKEPPKINKVDDLLRKINKPLKPLPAKRVWQPDPCSGMIGGIL